jgi:hypothetical protein
MSTDCLVLNICEFESGSGRLDTSMYILYDANAETFVIRGKRPDSWETYSFYCDNPFSTADFVSTVICKGNLWTYTLYNCDNLPDSSDDITFGTLEYSVRKENEITAYDKLPYSRKTLTKMLRIIKNVYNFY